MSDKPDIFMPLFLGDFTKHIARLNDGDVGSYILILMDYWINGAPPDDDATLAQVARCTPKLWPARRRKLAPFFVIADGVWRQKRVEEELQKAAGRLSRALAGAEGRWDHETRVPGKTRSERLAAAREKGTHTHREWVALQAFCGACVRCGNDGTLVKDHIVPIYQDGSDAIENIQPLCTRCNSVKGRERKDYRPSGWLEAVKTPAKTPAKRVRDAYKSPSPSTVESQPLTGLRDSTRREAPPLPPQGPAGLTREEEGRLAEIERRGLQGPGADALRRKARAALEGCAERGGGLKDLADLGLGLGSSLGGGEDPAERPVHPLGLGDDGRGQGALARLDS